MFTGLVQCVGQVVEATGNAPRVLGIHSAMDTSQIRLGDSVAIDGCCLTVVQVGPERLSFEAADETLAHTTMGRLSPGSRVNLEQAMRLSDRLGGHLVTGHVDAVGTIVSRQARDSAVYFGVRAPHVVQRLIAARGSVTVAGISLTVTAVQDDVFFTALIPHTMAVTTAADWAVGDPVNIEADCIARYVERLMKPA